MKRITIVSRHYPPNKNINGVLANQMAEYLMKDSDAEVSIFCMDADADGNTASMKVFGNVFRLKQRFNPNKKIGKLLNMLYDGYILIKKSKKHPSDLIIVTSSPPLLPLWASVLIKNNRKWAFWSLDLFPEGFVSANTIRESSGIFRFLKKRTYKHAPDLLIALGEEQAKHIQKNYQNPVPTIILPAGVTLEESKSDTPENDKPTWYNPGLITLGYFGNVGQAHNPEFIQQMISASSGKNFQFILSVYGIRAEEVKAFARQFDHVIVVENGLAQHHLQYIDVHLVTLRTVWTHAAVPSKAVTAISTGRPIIFCGSEESDNWQMFKEAAWFIPETKEMNPAIDRLISGITKEEISAKAALTRNIIVMLKQQVLDAYLEIGNMISKFFQTIITFGKIVLRSNYFISLDKSTDQSIIVLGNGPSLRNDIQNNREFFERSSLAVVNHFCHSEFFFQLKPKSYFLLDPAFFDHSNILESVEKTSQILINEVDWNIDFYVPFRSRNSTFVQALKKKNQFKVHFVNYVPAKGGFQWFNHLLFDLNLAMPQCQNVIVYTLFINARKGTEQIFLFGAENDWHANVKVNKENYLVLYDSHLYEEKKSDTEKILYTSSDKLKKTTMVDLLESSVKVFKGYTIVGKYAQKKEVRIYNCSKNSLIDAFERLDDEEFAKLC